VISATTIAAATANDPTARQEIYEAYLGYVLTIIRRYGISASEEVDVVQDIFIEIFVSLPKYDPSKGELKPWLRAVAVHQILKRIKNSKRLQVAAISQETEVEDTQLQLHQYDTAYILHEISQLSKGYQTVFNMYEIDGYSHKEIASKLKITVQTSKSQLSRAKNILRKKLRKFIAIL